MNITNLLKATAFTATLVVVFQGLSNVSTDLSQLGTILGYMTVAAILGLAAFDGARRTS